jgi:hypothetical protein
MSDRSPRGALALAFAVALSVVVPRGAAANDIAAALKHFLSNILASN